MDIPPDTDDFLSRGAERMNAAFTEIGETHASTVKTDSPHPLMHRTESVDYGVVISGEMTLILDKGETLVAGGGCRHPARDQPRVGEPVRQAVPNAVHPRRWPF